VVARKEARWKQLATGSANGCRNFVWRTTEKKNVQQWVCERHPNKVGLIGDKGVSKKRSAGGLQNQKKKMCITGGKGSR